ncbi:MAG: DsbA family oxidoreductase [Burkholderiales bacterium]|nr:DsbA family oxidoreductase [Burkholderiales bacterium]
MESALALFRSDLPDEPEPAVRWLPFQLNPDLPPQGMARKAYIERKFGPGGAHNYARVAAVGKEVGIDFAFDAITVQPNTVNAHRLMHYAARYEQEDAMAESLFRGYFQEGAVLTDLAQLAALGARAGFESDALSAYIASDQDRDAVLSADVEARRAGIGGVPYFIFNRRVAVSGAHEPSVLLGAMQQSLRRRP